MVTLVKNGAPKTKGASKDVGRRRRDVAKGDEGLFGQHLESLVERAGLSPVEFADKIGKDRDTVTLYFGGHRLPKLADYRKLASVLGLSSIRELIPDLPPTVGKKKPKKSG